MPLKKTMIPNLNLGFFAQLLRRLAFARRLFEDEAHQCSVLSAPASEFLEERCIGRALREGRSQCQGGEVIRTLDQSDRLVYQRKGQSNSK